MHQQEEQNLGVNNHDTPDMKTGTPVTAQPATSKVGPAINAGPTPSVSTGGGPTQVQPGRSTFINSLVNNPAAYNQVEQLKQAIYGGSSTFSKVGPIFVSEGTHYMDTDHEWGAQAYNLNAVAGTYGDLKGFEQAEPRTWLSNSAPVQLEQLNNEIFHFNDLAFANSFIVGTPSTINEVVRSNSSYDGLYGQPSGSNPISSSDQRSQMGGSTIGSSSSQPNPSSSFFDKASQTWQGVKSGGQEIGEGIASIGAGTSVLRSTSAASQYGSQLLSRVPLGNDIANSIDAELAEGVGAEEGTALLAGETAGIAGAEGLGVAGVIGATGGAAAIAIGVGLAAVGVYDVATALGAPTVQDDVDWLKSNFGGYFH